MDQKMVDVTNISDVKIGDEVILLRVDDNITYTADDMSDSIGGIGYEGVCGISKRVQRQYKGEK